MAAPDPSAPRRTHAGRTTALVSLIVLVLALVAFLAVRQFAGTASAEVSLEAVSTPGPNPFMPAVGTDQPDVRRVPSANGAYAGDTPGLFGGTNRRAVCDRRALSRFLRAHPDKRAAWAEVLGVTVTDVPSYIDGLTPVVLRADTMVTNHGWRDGAVTSFPAVLQAGTAVLVDRYGQIVTKCACGNPLSAPVGYSSVIYVGPRWASFTETHVTIVQRTTTINNTFSIVDSTTNTVIRRPGGTAGEQDTVSPGAVPDPGTPAGPGDAVTAQEEALLVARSWTAPASCGLPSASASAAGTTTTAAPAPTTAVPTTTASPLDGPGATDVPGAGDVPPTASSAPETTTTSAAPASGTTVSFAPGAAASQASTYDLGGGGTTFEPGPGDYSVSDVSATSVTLHGAPDGTCTLTPAS